jgi:hypothetical protein
MCHGAAGYRVWIVVLLGLVLALPGIAAVSSGGDVPSSTAWGEIDKLIAEDKLEEALPWVEELLGAARAAGDEETWTRALVQAAWLRERLRSSEDAAGFLHGQPHPSAPLYRAVVDLYYAEMLAHDLRASWQIHQREKVESEGELPLEQWTWEQIAAAALAAGRAPGACGGRSGTPLSPRSTAISSPAAIPRRSAARCAT